MTRGDGAAGVGGGVVLPVSAAGAEACLAASVMLDICKNIDGPL